VPLDTATAWPEITSRAAFVSAVKSLEIQSWWRGVADL